MASCCCYTLSLIIAILDIATDIAALKSFWERGTNVIDGLSLLIVIISLVIAISQVVRLCDVCGTKSGNDEVLTFLQFLESNVESIPQLMINLEVMVKMSGDAKINLTAQYVSATISLLAATYGTANIEKNCVLSKGVDEFDCLDGFLAMLMKGPILAARVLIFVCFAVHYGDWAILPLMVSHWVVMCVITLAHMRPQMAESDMLVSTPLLYTFTWIGGKNALRHLLYMFVFIVEHAILTLWLGILIAEDKDSSKFCENIGLIELGLNVAGFFLYFLFIGVVECPESSEKKEPMIFAFQCPDISLIPIGYSEHEYRRLSPQYLRQGTALC